MWNLRLPLAALLALSVSSWGCAASGSGPSGPVRTVVPLGDGGGSALFSPAVRSDQLVFLSGVIGREDGEGVQGATRQALEGVRQRVEAAGGTMADLVQCTVYLTNMDDYGAMNEAYVEYFPSDPPARTAIAVAAVPASARLEIACIAAVG